jgi:hypothetical protein
VSYRLATLTAWVALPLAAAGCSSTVKKPSLLHPGPANYQRANAVQFDPYPQNDMGPPIVGGRPREYAIPPNEVERANQYSDSTRWQTAPPPYNRY